MAGQHATVTTGGSEPDSLEASRVGSHQPTWTVDDVAAYLHVSPDTVYRLARKGLPRHRASDRRLLFIPAEVETWLRQQR
jgi:excisionase family DNA binding protein